MTDVDPDTVANPAAQLLPGDDTYSAVLRAMGITVQEALERGATWPQAMAEALGTGEAHGFALCGPDKVPVDAAWLQSMGEAFASGSVHAPVREWNARAFR